MASSRLNFTFTFIIIIINVIVNLFTHGLSNCVHGYLFVCVTNFCFNFSPLFFFFQSGQECLQ